MTKTQSTGHDPTVKPDRRAWVSLLMLTSLALAHATVTGRLTAHYVNDSASYLDYPFATLAEALLSIRTPAYPLLLRIVDSTLGILFVPLLQVLIHVFAAWLLHRELLQRRIATVAAWTASICVLLGCTFVDHVHTVSTDSIALSVAVISVVFLLKTTRCFRLKHLAATAGLAILAIAVRPAYLFLIPWLALAGWFLPRIDGSDVPYRQRLVTASVSLAVLAAVLGWMSLRWAVVGDFAILPFGHQNLSGISVQLLSTEELRGLAKAESVDDAAVAKLMKTVADRLEQSDYESPTEGQLPTLTLESQWDDINYFVVWPAAKEILQNDSDRDRDTAMIIREHRLIGAMNQQILSAVPTRYGRWLALAIRRAIWGTLANISMQPVFLLGIVSLFAYALSILLSTPSIVSYDGSRGWYAFCFAGITFWSFKTAFVILSSPPLGRFIDAAAVFLPAILFGTVAQLRRMKKT